MQIHPSNWDALLLQLHITQYRFTVNGSVMAADFIQGVPTIEKPMMLEPVIGRCCTGSLTIDIRQGDSGAIPKAASVAVDCRLSSYDKTITSDWIPQGRFVITQRSGYGDMVTLTCRDGMILAGKTYLDKKGITTWPSSMSDVLTDIARIMGVEIDSRTQIQTGEEYMISTPEEDVLMSEILGKIAAVHGGNFIMTESGKLRLVPFPSTSEPVYDLKQEYKTYTPYSSGDNTISRIILKNAEGQQYTVGDDTGVWITGEFDTATQAMTDKLSGGEYTLLNGTYYLPSGSISSGTAIITDEGLTVDSETGTASTVLNGLLGRKYTPYRLDGAYIDPCIELGDTFAILYRGQVLRLIANTMTINCTTGYTCRVENGIMYDDEEEVVYTTPKERQQERTAARAARNTSRIAREEKRAKDEEDGIKVSLDVLDDKIKASVSKEYVDGTLENYLLIDDLKSEMGSVFSEGDVDLAATIATTINTIDKTSEVHISADAIDLDGFVTVDDISAGKAYTGSLSVTGDVAAGSRLSGGTIIGTNIGYVDSEDQDETITMLSLINAVSSMNDSITEIQVIPAENNPNTYQLQKKTVGNSSWQNVSPNGTFSRATTLYKSAYTIGGTQKNAGWSGGTFTVRAEPQDVSISTRLNDIVLVDSHQDSTIKTQMDVTLKVMYDNEVDDDEDGETGFTKSNMAIDASDIYDDGQNAVSITGPAWTDGSNKPTGYTYPSWSKVNYSTDAPTPKLSDDLKIFLVQDGSFTDHKMNVYMRSDAASSSGTNRAQLIIDATSEYNAGWKAAHDVIGLPDTNTSSASMTVTVPKEAPSPTPNTEPVTYTISVDQNYAYIKTGSGSNVKTVAQTPNSYGVPETSVTQDNGTITGSWGTDSTDALTYSKLNLAASIPIMSGSTFLFNATAAEHMVVTTTKIDLTKGSLTKATVDGAQVDYAGSYTVKKTGSGGKVSIGGIETTVSVGANDLPISLELTQPTAANFNWSSSTGKYTYQTSATVKVDGTNTLSRTISSLELPPTEAIRHGTSLVTIAAPSWTGSNGVTIGGQTGQNKHQYQLKTSGRVDADGDANEDVYYLNPTQAFTHGFNICYNSIGLNETSKDLEPGTEITIYPMAKGTYDAAKATNITSKGITIKAKSAPSVSDRYYEGKNSVTLNDPTWSPYTGSGYPGSRTVTVKTSGRTTADGTAAAELQKDVALFLSQEDWSNNKKTVYLRTGNATNGTAWAATEVNAESIYSAGKYSVTVTGASIEANSVVYSGRTARGNMLVRLSNMDDDDPDIRLTGIVLDDVYQSGLDGKNDYQTTADFEFDLTDGTDDEWSGYYEDVNVSMVYQQGVHDRTPATPAYYVATNGGPAYFRYSTDNLDRIRGWLYARTEVTKLGESGNFTKISFDGVTGYIRTNSLEYVTEPTSPTNFPGKTGWSSYSDVGYKYHGKIRMDNVNLREDSTTASRIIVKMPNGADVYGDYDPDYLPPDNMWNDIIYVRSEHDLYLGWVDWNYVNKAQTEMSIVINWIQHSTYMQPYNVTVRTVAGDSITKSSTYTDNYAGLAVSAGADPSAYLTADAQGNYATYVSSTLSGNINQKINLTATYTENNGTTISETVTLEVAATPESSVEYVYIYASRNNNFIHMRNSPSTSAADVGLLKCNTKVQLISYSNGWAHVYYLGYDGYVQCTNGIGSNFVYRVEKNDNIVTKEWYQAPGGGGSGSETGDEDYPYYGTTKSVTVVYANGSGNTVATTVASNVKVKCKRNPAKITDGDTRIAVKTSNGTLGYITARSFVEWKETTPVNLDHATNAWYNGQYYTGLGNFTLSVVYEDGTRTITCKPTTSVSQWSSIQQKALATNDAGVSRAYFSGASMPNSIEVKLVYASTGVVVITANNTY